MVNKKVFGLTKYPSASFAEVATISFPLMLASLSGFLMNFCDRLILSQYTTDAMNAAATGGMVANIFSFGALGLVLIAEVFVANLYGSGQHKEAAQPVWQMIWFSLATIFAFLPISFLGPYLVPTEQFGGQALGYFRIWMYFGPLFPLSGALSAFFVGVGKVKIITLVTILSNIVNVLSDIVLVFGIEGYIPAMGTNGAALSTGVAQGFQTLFLFYIFLSPENRRTYGTDDTKFRWPLFLDCLRVGGPNAIGHMIEIAAWSVVLRLMAIKGEAYVTTLAIGQNLHMLFAFFSQGLQKAVITIAANLMGQNNKRLMAKLLRSAITMLVIIGAILFFPLAIYPDPIVEIFLVDEHHSQSGIFDIARKTGVWVWLFIMSDSLVWVMAGVLTAYRDTKFIMITNALTAWCLAVVPTYVFVNHLDAAPHYSWVIINLFGFVNALLFTLRVRYIQRIPA